MAEKFGYEELVIGREANLPFVRINDFSYAANVSYASLNIMFLTACKFSKFLASAAAFPCGLASLPPPKVAHVYLSLTFDIRGAL